MAKLKVGDIKELVSGTNCVAKGDNITDASIVDGIKIADASDEGCIPGDLVINAHTEEEHKWTRKHGAELWKYGLWTFKYRTPKDPSTLSPEALKLIAEVKALVESYPEEVCKEFVAMRKAK